MNTTTEQIETLLREALQPSKLKLYDDSAQHAGHAGAASGGGHFRLEIESKNFAGKNRVIRHRMVYDALQTLLPLQIHALAITAKAPNES